MKKNLTRIIITVVLILMSLYFLYPTYKDYNFAKQLKSLTGQDSVDFLDKNGPEITKSP